jgi:hypothetical protein
MPLRYPDSSALMKLVVAERESTALITWKNGFSQRRRAAAERVRIDVVAPA